MSLYQYYTSKGQKLPTVTERAKVYEQKGLGSASEYRGTADQNNKLESALRGGAGASQPSQPQNNNQPASQSRSGGGGGADSLPGWGKGQFTGQEVESGGSIWGWNHDSQKWSRLRSAGTSSQTSSTPSLDLQEEYDKLYEQEKIEELKAESEAKRQEILERERQSNEAEALVNENPFNAEATRVGKVEKIEEKLQDEKVVLNQEQALIDNKVAEAYGNIETRLGLATKQFDIDRATRADALSELNSVLKAGAINTDNVDDILAFAQRTGLSQQMVQAMVTASQTPEVKPHVVSSTDDGGNVTVSIVDLNTGQLINQQSLGRVGKADKSGGYDASSDKYVFNQAVKAVNTIQPYQDESGWIGIFPQFVARFAPTMSLEDIYRAYVTNGNPPPEENPSEMQELYLAARGEDYY